jgi:signal transduction histidine kinase/FixJ family two-component response regulator/HPt (histidine-containing phosphotransfer) domain-containing protein
MTPHHHHQPALSSEGSSTTRGPEDPRALVGTLAAADIGILEQDFRSGEMTWSDCLAERLGLAGALAKPTFEAFLEAVVAEDRSGVLSALRAAHDASAPQDRLAAEFRIRTAQGETVWLEMRGRVFRDAEGKPSSLQAVVLDVTQRRTALADCQTLQTACAAAEAANNAKSRFLANIGHELRTPLAGIVGLSELLQQTPVNDEQRDYLQTLSRSAEGLLSLLNDLLDFSKIEAGKLALDSASFDVGEVLADAVAVFAPSAQQKSLRLESWIDPSVPRQLIGDPYRLRQVLLNLVSNAVKFTDKGKVVVTVEAVAEEARSASEADTATSLALRASDQVLLRFCVRDTGIGIAADKLASIFDPFEQADRSTTRTHGGTGLGLPISARLVEMMGGQIRVDSLSGQGSTFAVTIPFRVETPGPAVPVSPPDAGTVIVGPGRNLHVLVVEDNAVNRQVLTLLLEKAGHRVSLAGNGREALEALHREPFDLVLMDLQMPEMDGLRATRLLRAHEKAVGGHVPVVAVTANALQGERQRCLAAGMDDYLSKPIRSADLFAVIARLVGSDAVSQPPRQGDKETTRQGEGGDNLSPCLPVCLSPCLPGWLTALRSMHLGYAEISRLARTFLDTVPGRLNTLRQALAENNEPLLARTAHTLKGSFTVFSAHAAIAAAHRLEELASEQRLIDCLAPLAELAAEAEALAVELNTFLQSDPTMADAGAT